MSVDLAQLVNILKLEQIKPRVNICIEGKVSQNVHVGPSLYFKSENKDLSLFKWQYFMNKKQKRN